MTDLLVILITGAFLILCTLYIHGLDRLRR